MKTRCLIEALESRIAPASIALGTSTQASGGDVTFNSGDTLSATLNDLAGSGKLDVTGTVTINFGAMLSIDVSQAPTDLTEFVVIENDGIDAINGTFAGLPEGQVFKADNTYFKVSYEGGDGNDLVLKALVPKVTIAANGKSATYLDTDGDLVTLKTSRGTFKSDSFVLRPDGDIDINGAQLTELKLDGTFANANLTITAKPGLSSGNGFANVGYLNATGVSLGTVSIKGDLARIDVGSSASSNSIKSLTVQSIGQFRDFTLESQMDPVLSTFTGRAVKLVTKSDIRSAVLISESGFGNVTVGGSFISSELLSGADIGAITIRHDLVGESSENSVIGAFGKAVAPTRGVDLAIKSITVGGRVEATNILAGYSTAEEPLNADASIGPVKVGGDWIASSILAGCDAGPDGFIGTGDDARFDDTMLAGYRNNDALVSQIASITIAGQVLGTASNTEDSFGFVAESIKSMRIGGTKLQLSRAANDDFLPLASTGRGSTGLRADVNLVEVYLLA